MLYKALDVSLSYDKAITILLVVNPNIFLLLGINLSYLR